MGNKIPTPVERFPVPAGVNVDTCWGPDKPFGEVITPIQLVLRVSGVVPGPGWIPTDGEIQESEYLLTQQLGLPRFFPDQLPNFIARVWFRPAATNVIVRSTTGVDIFFANVPLVCQDFIDNELTDAFTGGTVRVWLLGTQS